MTNWQKLCKLYANIQMQPQQQRREFHTIGHHKVTILRKSSRITHFAYAFGRRSFVYKYMYVSIKKWVSMRRAIF